MELEQKFDQLGSLFEEFKKGNDARLKEIEKKGSADPLLTEKVEKTNDAISAVQAEIKAMQTAMNRTSPTESKASGENKADAEYKSAFNRYVRKGNESEIKALSVESDPDGGYLVSPEMNKRIVEKLFEVTPMRELAEVVTLGSDALETLQDVSEMDAGWVGEIGSRSTTNSSQFKLVKVPTHEIYAQPAATQKMLDDASFNIEQYIANKVAKKFSRDEGTAFISGNGVAKPMGILSYASGTSFGQIEQVNSGSAATITADGLITLFYSLKGAYRKNASWLMQRLTIAAVRKLKGSDNNYLWQPGLAAGAPDTLLGRPLVEGEDMPALQAGSLSVAVGDFKAGYQIVDRLGIRTLRDPFTAKPYVLFYTIKRVGGGVVDFDAIKLGKCST